MINKLLLSGATYSTIGIGHSFYNKMLKNRYSTSSKSNQTKSNPTKSNNNGSLPGILKDFLDLIIQIFFVLIIYTIATYFNITKYFAYFIGFSLYWTIKSFFYKKSKLSIKKLIKIFSFSIIIGSIITLGLGKVVVPLLEKGVGPMVIGTAATASAVTGSTYSAITAVQFLEKNASIKPSSSLDVTKHPGPSSPSDIPGGGFIPSPNEIEIPLLGMLDSLLIFNCIELNLMFSIFVVFFRFIINPKIKILILKILSYLVKNKIEFSDKEVKINSIFNASGKYSNYAIALMLITLILIKIINLFFLFYLNENIDSFINVYNKLKKE